MQHRRIGKSELKIPIVSLGTWAAGGLWWGGPDDENAVRAIQAGIDAGVTCIDTAPIYGMGHSESLVAKAIKGRREQVIIATKCGLRWDLEEGEHFFDIDDNAGIHRKVYRNLKAHSIRKECEDSLRRLDIDAIDLYQCHWPDGTTPIDETMTELLALQKEGKIREIGVSNFTVQMMEACLEHGDIASDQPKYNALERGIEEDLLPFCAERKIGVLAYSPIAQGLLTGKVAVDREFPEGDQRRYAGMFSRENRQRILDMLEELRPIADGHGISFGQLFTAWLVAQPGMTSALVGARNETQATENARAGEVRLTEDEINALRQAVEMLRPLG